MQWPAEGAYRRAMALYAEANIKPCVADALAVLGALAADGFSRYRKHPFVSTLLDTRCRVLQQVLRVRTEATCGSRLLHG